MKVKDVNQLEDTRYYLGKRVVYVYKTKTIKRNSKFRTIWGKVVKAHGNNGLVRARFSPNLPPKALGGQLRVMLYPNKAV